MTICRERGNIFKQSASRSFTSEISGLRKQYGMRGWRNWQTRTFEVRVVYPWGFESPPSHQKPVHIVCWFFFLCEGADLEQHYLLYKRNRYKMGTPLIDIPTGWDPQAKQSRTVALLAALCAAALFESSPVAQKESPAHESVSGILGATGRIRTSGLPGRSRTLYPAELRSHIFISSV